MGILTPETMKLIAREMYDYDLSDRSARAVANTAGAMVTVSHHMSAMLKLGSIEFPFGYPNLDAEATRLRERKA